jgi:hypothetical protein
VTRRPWRWPRRSNFQNESLISGANLHPVVLWRRSIGRYLRRLPKPALNLARDTMHCANAAALPARLKLGLHSGHERGPLLGCDRPRKRQDHRYFIVGETHRLPSICRLAVRDDAANGAIGKEAGLRCGSSPPSRRGLRFDQGNPVTPPPNCRSRWIWCHPGNRSTAFWRSSSAMVLIRASCSSRPACLPFWTGIRATPRA